MTNSYKQVNCGGCQPLAACGEGLGEDCYQDSQFGDDWAGIAPSEELMIRITYIDRHGMIQHSMTRTSVCIAEFEAYAEHALAAMHQCFESLGGEVISTLIIRESGNEVVDLTHKPLLRLVG